MPRKKNGELPLPAGWEMESDFDGRPFFINHSAQITSWVDPRDRFTKPHTFADCVGDELPYGWEHAMDAHVGSYYINHLQHTTQIEDPRLQWRSEQEDMLRSYLGHAQNDLAAKKEIYRVKQERLVIAQEEVQNLNRTVASQWASSRTSLNSTTSTKYDPDLLKADVALARNRVSRLNHEVAQADAEVKFSEQGLRTLQSIDEKMTQHENPSMYSMEEAQQILTRIKTNQKSISASYQHKKQLLQSLAKLRSCSNKGLQESSPRSSEEKLNTGSQTELSWEPHTNPEKHLGDIVRMQAQYDEAFKQVSHLQMQLASVENQIDPTHAESDKDRLLLIQEKDQLLRELRGMSVKGHSDAENQDLQSRIHQLEADLTKAMQVSNQQIAQRLKLNESKTEILQKLADATQLTTYLESQIRGLSMSSLSVSSGSSRGSLGSLSTGSKGSLNSLSISDIYSASSLQDVNLVELHRRVERLLTHVAPTTAAAGSKESLARSSSSPVSSLCSLSPPVSPYEAAPPPSYAQHIQKHWQQPQCSIKSVSPIQEIEGEMAHLTVQQQQQQQQKSVNCCPSVSAAISDESVAGDSGVFEAAYKKTTSTNGEDEPCVECAQIQVKLKYEGVDGRLLIGIEQARNLHSLAFPSHTSQVCIKASLVPSQSDAVTFCTKALKELQSPKFNETFSVAIAENKLASKTLQLYIWCLESTHDAQYCLGSAQVCLSAFDPKHVSLCWHNVLSFHFMLENNPPLATEPSKYDKPPPPYVPKSDKIQQLLEDSSQRLASECQSDNSEAAVAVLKEESSDESTIISSQTSTLTRSRGPSEMDEEQEEEEETEEEEVVEEEEVIVDQDTIKQCQTPMLQALLHEQAMYGTLIPRSDCTETRCAKTGASVIRRSQTFSPVTKVNEYVCKLTRSDSDSSVSTNKRNVGSFQRNTIDRRSVRLKKPQRHSLSPSALDPRVARTSIDLELDLKASEVKLSQLNEDISRLEELKVKLEHAKNTGQMEPDWLCNNEQLQHFLAQTDALLKSKENKRSRGLEERAERLMNRVTRDAKKMRQASVPDVHAFREKMAFFTKMRVSVPAIPSSENEVDAESNS
ncbi:hypothetical protein CAPTEDRAFT_225766 [Capitella teleta]|uniref:Protein kibra n=1 Tax=Capitella teleta TaxID=283909 RepID=R7T7C3_CAPTE|nr:hypothetical protein CAPTEDRAFT_225766 [Capitella teleta]|eukprot:ELT89303.1 hypothetical protein CAPTEDRAFT_225766 [Capitella teleta]